MLEKIIQPETIKLKTFGFKVGKEYHFVTVKDSVSKEQLIKNLNKAYCKKLRLTLENEFTIVRGNAI